MSGFNQATNEEQRKCMILDNTDYYNVIRYIDIYIIVIVSVTSSPDVGLVRTLSIVGEGG